MAGSLVLVQTKIPKELHRAAVAAAREDHRTLASLVLIFIERGLGERARPGVLEGRARRPRHRRGGR